MKRQQIEPKFVTMLALVIMGFFGYSTIVSFLSLVVYLFKSPVELLGILDSYVEITPFIPPAIIHFLENYYIEFSTFSLVFSLIILTASFSLLKRRNWARIFIIGFMLLTIVLSIASLFFHDFFMLDNRGNEYIREAIEKMNDMIGIFLAVFAIVVVLLHGWAAWMLLSQKVRNEFTGK